MCEIQAFTARMKRMPKYRGLAKGLRFSGPFEAEAKNVAKPLRYFRLKSARG